MMMLRARTLFARAPRAHAPHTHISHVSWLLAVEACAPARVTLMPGFAERVSARTSVAASRLLVDEVPAESLVSVELEGADDDAGAAPEVLVECPQRVATHVRVTAGGGGGGGGGVRVAGKLEGDVTLDAHVGDVIVERSLKGARVAVMAARGAVELRGHVEAGDADVFGARGVTAKRVAAARARFAAGDADNGSGSGSGGGVDIGALYCADAALDAARGCGVRVRALHGVVRVSAIGDGPAVRVRGITGAVTLDAPARDARLHFDSPRGLSRVSVGGDVALTFTSAAALRVRIDARAQRVYIVGAGGAFSGQLGLREGTFEAIGELRAAAEGDGDSGLSSDASAERVTGGSGKVREGAPIAGFYGDEGDAAADAAPPTVVVRAGGSVTIAVISYADAMHRAVAEER